MCTKITWKRKHSNVLCTYTQVSYNQEMKKCSSSTWREFGLNWIPCRWHNIRLSLRVAFVWMDFLYLLGNKCMLISPRMVCQARLFFITFQYQDLLSYVLVELPIFCCQLPSHYSLSLYYLRAPKLKNIFKYSSDLTTNARKPSLKNGFKFFFCSVYFSLKSYWLRFARTAASGE